jgi:C-terminal processing protease CtpA/Prc
MSGLDIVYNGKQMIKEAVHNISKYKVSDSNSVSFSRSCSYKFKSSNIVKNVVKNSPADSASLKAGDLIVKIKNKSVHASKLNDIIAEFNEKLNRKIQLKIKRLGIKMTF